ncbi:transcription factor PAP1-domain-containing protein [Triangularia setosa]|uniref:Transcription factor PAP1-domain-containing protein n=1 Tax=Triangularia setosa TaxID=2587417 RepID=A0AAN6W389_9PEZI|nr:transcription factor PAP1-domain-containing protein [Podospora setosa]
MASTRNPVHDFILTPQQQNLLYAALNSNRKGTTQANPGINMSPLQFNGSPLQENLGSFQGSPDFDYDYDFTGGDSTLDFSFHDGNQPKMIGDLPGTSDGGKSDSPDDTESPDKRSHPDDDEDETRGPKRRESEDKVAKKPGRKPLTTEPSSKRKAQNRAAQRAFRERKEKHLKELETKVEELEKASESHNKEKQALRAQVDKMTVELNEYKKRLSTLSNGRPSYQGPMKPFGAPFLQNMNDVNFQFEFPKFGTLPGPNVTNDTKKSSTSTTSSVPPRRSNSDTRSPLDKSNDSFSPNNSSTYSPLGLNSHTLDSQFNLNGPTTTSSPSASSNSNMGGANSSCGTSPEPFTQSPMGFKPIDTLATIGEEQSGFNGPSQEFGHFGDVNDFNWLPQTDFQFEPQLFGDYREPQESILSNGFDDSFFNDALDADFITPYNLPLTSEVPAPKPDLLAQIDAAKESDQVTPSGQLLTCTSIWEKLQTCPKVQNGDFDLDGLCSDLQKKAKCSGGGAVVAEEDFKHVMQKYLCKDDEGKADLEAAVKEATTKPKF